MAKVAAARVAAIIDEGAAMPVDVGELSDLLGYALKQAQPAVRGFSRRPCN